MTCMYDLLFCMQSYVDENIRLIFFLSSLLSRWQEREGMWMAPSLSVIMKTGQDLLKVHFVYLELRLKNP